jgi:hypothetical protein
MVEMVESGPEDLEQIQAWTRVDPWHHHQNNPKWWLTGNGFLSFRLQDEHGPICYARIDREGDQFRLNCQFGPSTEVSRRRVVEGLTYFFTRVPQFLGGSGMRFDSDNPGLIRFLSRWGFKPSGSGDYVLEHQVRVN